MAPGDRRDRTNLLNAVRLVLAVMVIVSHAWPIGRFGPEPQLGQLTLGRFAVAGFFAISGWLIVQSRVNTDLPAFTCRRLVRIYPGYLVAITATAFLFAPLGAAFAGRPYQLSDSFRYLIPNLGIYIRTWTVGATLPPDAYPAWNGSLWTLIHEVGCYAVVGLLVSICGRRQLGPVVAGCWLASTAAALLTDGWGRSLLVQFLPLAALFFAGATLLLYRHRLPLRGRAATFAALVAAAVIVGGFNPAWVAMPIAYAVLWVGSRAPSWAPFRHADFSYGTYVYAFPVQQLLFVAAVPRRLGLGGYLALCVLGTLLFAVASWYAVERPAQRFRHVLDRFGRPVGGDGRDRRVGI